jgi:hypothetical protein
MGTPSLLVTSVKGHELQQPRVPRSCLDILGTNSAT